jgi:hypothetical protein
MAQSSTKIRVRPLAWGATNHAAVRRLRPLFTRSLPRPVSGNPHRADLRQAWSKRLRPAHHCGRWNPYAVGEGTLATPRSILSLMASIVLPPVRRLLLAALGLPALLAPCRLTAGPRAVALAAVAATADGERSLAAPTVAQVKNRNLTRRHRSLQTGALWTTAARLCEAPGTLEPRLRPQRDRGNEPKTPAPTGVFFCPPQRGQAYPPPLPALYSRPASHIPPPAALRAG